MYVYAMLDRFLRLNYSYNVNAYMLNIYLKNKLIVSILINFAYYFLHITICSYLNFIEVLLNTTIIFN